MATKQCPPQEELEYQIRGDKVLFTGDKALPADIISKWLNDHVYEEPVKALRVTMDTPFGSDIVYLENEYADPSTRLGLLTGGIDPVSDEYHALRVGSDGRLLVDAAITIQDVEIVVEIDVLDGDQIGIWGYENADSNFPVPVNVTSNGEVRVLNVLNSDMGTIYNEGTYSGSIEHSLVSHTVSPGEAFNLVKISGEGRTDAIFRVKVNSLMIERKRNNWTERNVVFNYSRGIPLVPGDTIELTIEHNQLTSKPFSGSIYGEDL